MLDDSSPLATAHLDREDRDEHFSLSLGSPEEPVRITAIDVSKDAQFVVIGTMDREVFLLPLMKSVFEHRQHKMKKLNKQQSKKGWIGGAYSGAKGFAAGMLGLKNFKFKVFKRAKFVSHVFVHRNCFQN